MLCCESRIISGVPSSASYLPRHARFASVQSLSLLAHSSCVLANIPAPKPFVFSDTFHSFALFLTLAEISPLFAHSCEKHRGTHPRTRSKTSMPVGTSSLTHRSLARFHRFARGRPIAF